eukprot:gb/GECH01011953.1/.p1 GENE.gb/GECH01011953.1/~~gb/GECH01011953.1/.p1  ORF type:complete len:342 (+),score=86.16 gb/GECH01011953.1/:1-1026(+)
MKSQQPENILPFNPFDSLLLASSVAQMLQQTEKKSNQNLISKESKKFQILQEDVLTKIFSFLGPQDLCTVGGVSQLCNKVSKSQELWKALFHEEFITRRSGIPRKIVLKEINKIANETSNWKIAYLEHFKPHALILKAKVKEECKMNDNVQPMRVTRQRRGNQRFMGAVKMEIDENWEGEEVVEDDDDAEEEEETSFQLTKNTRSNNKRGVKRSSPTSQSEPKRKRRRNSPSRATTWLSIVSAAITALANKAMKSEVEDERLYFTNKEICAHISEHWDDLCKGKKRTTTWWHTVSRELTTNPSVFKSGYHLYHEYGYWTLHELDQDKTSNEPVPLAQSVSS